MSSFDRRKFLQAFSGALALGAAAPFTIHFARDTAHAQSRLPSVLRADSSRMFDLSVASGDPSASGVILWTRIRPDAVVAGRELSFQVANDATFSQLVLEGSLPAAALSAKHDFTVQVDLDGQLSAGRLYFYRFVYGDTASRTGRCRTLPAVGARGLKLAILSCQDYTNGYYGALRHVADDSSIDFVVHLGDFIYESAADPRFQSLPFEDRIIVLPSGGSVALGLEDYRHIYRTYRSDPMLQRALEQHTWIIAHDDHETANDCYWDYELDTLGAPDHPYQSDVGALRRLKLDSQRAWREYTPARIEADEGAVHPHDYFRSYRDFRFGDLLRLNMLDTRTYRTSHACGEGDLFERYLPLGCTRYRSPEQGLLGREQSEWLVDRLARQETVWNVLGNQTFFGRLSVAGTLPVNLDAWDGFEAERRWLTRQIAERDVDNLVVLTGDLHSYIASQVKLDYGNINPFDTANQIGVEFMTPSVTSSALFDVLLKDLRGDPALADGLSAAAVRLNNPHIKFFNSSMHGYSTVRFTGDYCEWIAYAVEKSATPETATRKAVARFRKNTWWPYLVEQSLRGY